MRRLISCLAVIAFVIAAPYAARELPKEPAVEVSSGSALRVLADGLYEYKGVDTRHGPQCVELAERFYQTHHKGTFPYHNSGPGAYDIWEGVAENKNVGGWATHRQYFAAYENGTSRPQADDMLLYYRTRGGGWGHIAIIAEVHEDAVVVLEQNSGYDTHKILPLIGNRIVDQGVKGVIRLKERDKN